MKLVYQYIVIFFNFKPYQIIFIRYKPRIARLVVDEDDNGTFRLKRVKSNIFSYKCLISFKDL